VKFVAIDGEFDQHDKKNVLVKISIVDDQGQILVDTLVNPRVSIDYSCEQIHGIKKEWLSDAPSVD
jgi:DNA polymerase III subunit epsilon